MFFRIGSLIQEQPYDLLPWYIFSSSRVLGRCGIVSVVFGFLCRNMYKYHMIFPIFYERIWYDISHFSMQGFKMIFSVFLCKNLMWSFLVNSIYLATNHLSMTGLLMASFRSHYNMSINEEPGLLTAEPHYNMEKHFKNIYHKPIIARYGISVLTHWP